MFNSRIAAAVSAAIGLTAAAGAFAGPTPTVANGAAHRIFVAGSSAAAAGFINYVENQLCTGGWSTFNTPTTAAGLPDFRAVSCSTSANAAVFKNSTLTVWYRAEGGSAIGVLPVLNGTAIKQLDLGSAAAACAVVGTTGTNTAYSCTGVTGTASVNGTADSWGGAVLAQNIDVGVSDLEPSVFGTLTGSSAHAVAGGGNHDAFGTYSTVLTGATNQKVSDINNKLTTTPIFQQVFGFAVSTGLGITDLPKAQIAAIFDGAVTDWSNVGKSDNTRVKTTPTTIIVCNREVGSGTRAAADIFLNGTGCSNVGAAAKLQDFDGVGGQPANNLQTFAELDCVNTHANAIGYASIDNLTAAKIAATWPAINALAVDGVVPSLNAAGLGAYEFVFEAAVNRDLTPSTDGLAFYNAVAPALQDVNTTSTSAQVLAIPNLDVNGDNVATVPLSKGTVAPNTNVPVSDFTRGANSCTPLTHG
jgi:ABC-type phosphate transport system substrate-binding protein